MAAEGAWPDAESRRHAFEFPAGGDERPAEAIAEAVTWFGAADGEELEPLEAVVDLEWLSTLFSSDRDAGGADRSADARPGPSLAFEYGGCLVTVEPARFTIEPATARRPPAAEATPD